MRRFNLVILALSSVLTVSVGCGSSSSGSKSDSSVTEDSAAGSDAPAADTGTGADTAAADTGGTPDTAADDGATADVAAPGDGGAPGDGSSSDGGNPVVARGLYLVGVLGCNGCHTPKNAGGMPDTTMTLSGIDCFVSTPGCLSSANLTPDMATGIGGFSDQAIIDAFRAGKDPDPMAAGKYLFARMPYYQFAPLSDDDAKAIVAYLRSLPPITHAVKEATTPFDQAPTAPEWTAVDPSKLPTAVATAPADAAQGKYLASILCVTCHSPAAAGTPKHVDETTAFQGGQSNTITVGNVMMMFDSANLTPDATGIKDWSAMDLVTAIKTAKDKMNKTLCSPMRGNAIITPADATAIADYLLNIPGVPHAVAACMARM